MKFIPSLRHLMLSTGVFLVPGSLMAQTNITWGSQGLPPGLSLVSSNLPVGSVRVQGTPTKAGVYSAVVYPIVNGVFGDMNELSFRILPAGVNLPTFYGYWRRIARKDGSFQPLSGGGTWILGNIGYRAEGDQVAFTSTGQSFSGPRNTPVGRFISGASAGTNHVLAIYQSNTSDPMIGTGWSNTAYSSLNGAAFAPDGPLPSQVATNNGSVSLTSDGQSRYFLISLHARADWGVSPAPATARVWSKSFMAGSWSGPDEVQLPANNPFYYNTRVSFAAAGNIALLALSEGQSPQLLSGLALLRSTNSGASWTQTSANISPTSVAYDALNKRFVASAPDGVYTSTNGSGPWTRRSTENVGSVIYSSFHKLLFSTQSGVSSDGANWMPYGFTQYAPLGNKLTANFDGSVIFLDGQQLSSVYIPSVLWPAPQIGRVNKTFTYELKVD